MPTLRRGGRGTFCSASGTHSIQFEIPSGEMKPIGRSNLPAQPLDGLIFKLDDVSTVRTDQVIMVPLRRDIVIMRFISESPRLRKPLVTQHAHRPINRVERGSTAVSIEQAVEAADGDVILLQESRDDLFALQAPFQAGSLQTRSKSINGLLRRTLVFQRTNGCWKNLHLYDVETMSPIARPCGHRRSLLDRRTSRRQPHRDLYLARTIHASCFGSPPFVRDHRPLLIKSSPPGR